MSITDALARITQIQAQLADLTSGTVPAAPPVTAAPTAPLTAGQGAGGSGAGGPSFQTMLARAQGAYPPASVGAAGFATSPTGGVGASATASLPAAASGMLTSGQATFASRLASDTGLDPRVICAWVLAEENQGAARTREAAGNHDWLNIGYTDAGTYGAADGVWRDPATAADATAGWLRGQNTIPGYGTAASGIQAILATAGQSPQAQVAAIQSSGWASSGYPDLPALVAQLGG